MPASCLSVAVATATAITNSSTSSLTQSSSSLEHLSPTSIYLPFKAPKSINFCKLKPHFHLLNSSAFSQVSRSLLICASAAFDSFDAIQTEQVVEEETTSSQEEEEEEGEEENDGAAVAVSHSTESRRLYVGNLPYSMTSSQLSDVFAEVGRVVSVEVCSLRFLIAQFIKITFLDCLYLP